VRAFRVATTLQQPDGTAMDGFARRWPILWPAAGEVERRGLPGRTTTPALAAGELHLAPRPGAQVEIRGPAEQRAAIHVEAIAVGGDAHALAEHADLNRAGRSLDNAAQARHANDRRHARPQLIRHADAGRKQGRLGRGGHLATHAHRLRTGVSDNHLRTSDVQEHHDASHDHSGTAHNPRLESASSA